MFDPDITGTFATNLNDEQKQLHAAQSEAVVANQQVLVLAAANEKLTEQNHNLCLLVVRLARRVRFFEKGSDVATKALDYLSRNGLMPSVLREEKK